MPFAYLDASALVKLVVQEAESQALRRELRGYTNWASSKLAQVELARGVQRRAPSLLGLVGELLDQLTLVELSDEALSLAAELPPSVLRALDSIHVASALLLGDELDALVTYDQRMAEAAMSLGIPVVSPA